MLAITGASGAIYGYRILEELRKRGHEVHLVISRNADFVLEHELGKSREELEGMASCAYAPEELHAPIASGTCLFDAMVIAPCSMKTLACIANGIEDNLITRCASVALKEKRKLVLVPRETPLSPIHLENMLKVARAGVVVLPAMPAFYGKPSTVRELVDYIVGKVMDALGVEYEYPRWPTGKR